ncbi:glutathione S-transferase family protein [Salaquimonas pukyongi]|uniref:glutathione S-transferase family protein n=1 Tax=Salaquimonas pukyongi TaxID=2712698 RepID=UPI00096B8192|nr:glutathione S-transferase family protein [Salaquimonas pukyongi]
MSIKLYELAGKDTSRPFSPHCWKARMALAHKQLEYETVPVGFTEVPDIENGGQGIVPVIRHGERVIADSFQIALHLREAYPDRDGHLFQGEGSIALSRFIEAWSNSQLHPWIIKWAALDIHNMLNETDQAYFRESREKRFGVTLEAFVEGREERAGQLQQLLAPIRLMLKHQPYLGGTQPMFADYIPFGALQWLRICSGLAMWDKDDPVRDWFERLLDLHDGVGRSVPEAQ